MSDDPVINFMNDTADSLGLPVPEFFKAPPATPEVPKIPTLDPAKTEAEIELAKSQQKKRTAAAQGRSSTIKTGPQGLGEPALGETTGKSLLGY